ncbi:hypothetical protein Asi03nite_47120 [Actinoplanes siamensis]|uniref:Uncharacterized protein n=1 Tax=Actinoplanes siamensis TaxID=1223317 RepID=A0A919N9T0_9ACTN|nr:hypothetical protein Asi03nite_47120 [Actinoplanes siamensis]
MYALVLAPAVWVLAGVGFTHDLTSRGRDFFAAESLSGLLLLLFAGILYAIMTFSPISPLGPAIAGAAFLGVTYWAWSAPESYAGVWPADVVKDGFDLSRPGYGLAALLAVPLLGTMLSARRWARYEPPVLPIIGEIGRFRGSAKVAGVSVAAAETTVLRTAQTPRRPADATVAMPPAAPAAPAAPATSTVPSTSAAPASSAASTAPAASEDATVALPATPKASAAPAAGEKKPASALGAVSQDTTTLLPVTRTDTTAPAESNKSGITANSTIAATDEKTVSQPAGSAGDGDGPVAVTLPAKNPDDEATEVLHGLVTPPGEQAEVAKLP